jgi:hypothetical protein
MPPDISDPAAACAKPPEFSTELLEDFVSSLPAAAAPTVPTYSEQSLEILSRYM